MNNGFFKNHADTLAIIGVNLAAIAILISLWVANTSRIDATNARVDAANARSDQLHERLIDLIQQRKV